MLRVHFLLLQVSALGDELVLELLLHLDDTVRLELVAGRLRGVHGKALVRLLLQKEIQRLLHL